MAQLNFDANNVAPNVGLEAVPAGKYEVVIVDSEMKDTKTGNGKYLQLTMQIIDGEYKGRKLWTRLNLNNPSADAVRIAQGELSAICRAVNVMTLKDTAQIHNLPMIVGVGVEKNKQTDELQNKVKAYYAKAASAPASIQTSTDAPWGAKK